MSEVTTVTQFDDKRRVVSESANSEFGVMGKPNSRSDEARFLE